MDCVDCNIIVFLAQVISVTHFWVQLTGSTAGEELDTTCFSSYITDLLIGTHEQLNC
jgi:hypothetical protein